MAVWNKDQVKALRRKLGKTQIEFAQLLGCRQQTVSEWELGLYAPANAYGRLLDRLIGRTELHKEVHHTPSPLGPVSGNAKEVKEVHYEVYEAPLEFDPAID